jgi:hypothetical protein
MASQVKSIAALINEIKSGDFAHSGHGGQSIQA